MLTIFVKPHKHLLYKIIHQLHLVVVVKAPQILKIHLDKTFLEEEIVKNRKIKFNKTLIVLIE